MTREISTAESWETVYEAYQQVNFTAFDYESVKQNLVSFIRLYFPEQFNDFIESSEIVMIIEAFAYITEILAYRIDVASHENFILTAERKQSVLRLAKLISYNPTRNLPARGLVKITSVSTSENVFDSRGRNLANGIVRWNDNNNPDWKEQFFIIINRILQQEFGSVTPSDRIQVDDVLFELYSLNNSRLNNGVIQYTTTVSNTNYPMELVPVSLNKSGPLEKRPNNKDTFSIVYGNDGLGDASSTTGFFCFTKQGTLQKQTLVYDGITPNQTTDVNIDNINDTDVWLNEINPDTGETISTTVTDILNRDLGVQGEWEKVVTVNGQNIVFNTNLQRNKFEIETLENDQIRLIFGDGEFAEIPSGTFELWTRTSANKNLVIPQSSIVNNTATMQYADENGINHTMTITFSLVNTLTNASESEDIEHIRRVAPAIYHTQDRMVNGSDYNNFPLQDPSIIKLRTTNRTFAGDSKYITWHDPSNRYENVKLFGDDLLIFYKTDEFSITGDPFVDTPLEFIVNDVEPLLIQVGLTVFHILNDLELPSRQFSTSERADLNQRLIDAENTNGPLYPIYVEYKFTGSEYEWIFWDASQSADIDYPDRDKVSIVIERSATQWTVYYKNSRLIVESPTTRFWFNNSGDRVVTIDTLNSNFDTVSILSANPSRDRDGILQSNIVFNVIGNEVATILPDTGLPNITQLQVVTLDTNNDTIPDNMKLENFLDWNYPYTLTTSNETITLPFSYINGHEELTVTNDSGVPLTFSSPVLINNESNEITITDGSVTTGDDILIKKNDYVYFTRSDTASEYTYTPATLEVKRNWFNEGNTTDNSAKTLNQRYRGRDELNFSWFHSTPRFNLIDAAASNIHDMLIITRGYYTAFQSYLADLAPEPPLPTSLELRSTYQSLLDSKMLSDSVILHPGQFKLMFGDKSIPELRAKLVVVRTQNGSLTDNEIKLKIINTVRNYFDINSWEFGETFYFTELNAAIHAALVGEIYSSVIVPTFDQNFFGEMFQVNAQKDEILQVDIGVEDIEIVEFLNRDIIRQNG